jgi:Adenosylcobinamide amidohydrolase.
MLRGVRGGRGQDPDNGDRGEGCALQDLNLRGSYAPQVQATGTGTDDMIVVPGEGARITYTGGHSKMGEAIAKAV